MSNPWLMAGTDGSNEYVVLAVTGKGRIGIRYIGLKLHHKAYRIRVEPASWSASLLGLFSESLPKWSQPEGDVGKGNLRFSTVVIGQKDLRNAVAQGYRALEVSEEHLGDDCPDWARYIVGMGYTTLQGKHIPSLDTYDPEKDTDKENETEVPLKVKDALKVPSPPMKTVIVDTPSDNQIIGWTWVEDATSAASLLVSKPKVKKEPDPKNEPVVCKKNAAAELLKLATAFSNKLKTGAAAT